MIREMPLLILALLFSSLLLALTPVWVSHYGSASGRRLMAINPDGGIVIADEPQWP